jgi:hypothetical protein
MSAESLNGRAIAKGINELTKNVDSESQRAQLISRSAKAIETGDTNALKGVIWSLSTGEKRDEAIIKQLIKHIDSGVIGESTKSAFMSEIAPEKAVNVKKVFESAAASAGPAASSVTGTITVTPFAKLTKPNSTQIDEAQAAIDEFVDRMTGGGDKAVIDGSRRDSKTVDGYRIDLQNVVSSGAHEGYFNFQIQTGPNSIAKVLIKPGSYDPAKIKEAFNTALKEAKNGNGVILN